MNDEVSTIKEPRLWVDDGWTAKIIKNEDDDGWAVAMIKDGQPEPALVGPWTMGRDKRNPKPLDSGAFITLVKTAKEFVRRHEQQLHASLNQSVNIDFKDARVDVRLTIHADDENPSATLSAIDETGELVASVNVPPNFKLTRASAFAWAEKEFRKP
jgi:hypothetical protein